MIHIFIIKNCSSCRRLVEWLKDHDLPYKASYLDAHQGKPCGIAKPMIYHLLSLTENGVDDILSKRSLAYQAIKDIYLDMTTSQLVDYIYENPTVLRRPITIKGEIYLIGINQEELTAFLPRDKRT